MKMIALLVVLISSAPAHAGPYFRLIDPAKPYKVVGAFVDPRSPGNTAAGTAVALVTHSVRDGCYMPSVVCTDWAPVMAGFAVNAGRVEFNLGPAVNLTPLAKRGLLGVLNAVSDAPTLDGVKSLLGSEPISGPDVSVSFGPALAVSPIARGILLPVSEWQGKFRIFAGAALKFN